MLESPRAAYVHVPFCRHRCAYCNFTLIAGRDDLVRDYLRAVELELRWLSAPCDVDSLFFGGGTPSHLPTDSLRRMFAICDEWFPRRANAEVSLEANPNDVDTEFVELCLEVGATRLSLGAQSFDAAKLNQLDREHSSDDIVRAVELARPGFQSVALDLIFAAPNETREQWSSDLYRAAQLPVDHVSTYGLTVEKGTAYWMQRARGQWQSLPEDEERWRYEQALRHWQRHGFEHYEVSNFAKPGFRCRHNEAYWTGQPYHAVGPGAARYVDGWRETNHRSTTTYLRRVLSGRSPVAERERLNPEDAARERLVFGLRRLEGVPLESFAAETGFTVESLGGTMLAELLELGMLRMSTTHLRLTHQGLMISDSISARLL